MKIIFKIAKAELQVLFYSPIAWVILILFTFQVSLDFVGLLNDIVKSNAMGYAQMNITSKIFGGWNGILSVVQGSLYLYIPLLTMNLMSRELNSGSIKLLYSSPVTNTQIILGKYLSMVIYSLVLIGILSIYVIYGACTIDNFDYVTVLSGLLGLFLLSLAYSSIGLFMSSLTSYQVVAAIGTLAVLTLLNSVSGWWQDVAFVRDLTYWLAMPGRAGEFVQGMICSENVLYFIIVIVLFLSLAILRLQSRRVKKSTSVVLLQYVGVWVIALGLGYFSSRPAMKGYYDTTLTKSNTITPNSRNIVEKFDGDLTITTYVNLLDKDFWVGMPENINSDKKLFERYIRYKPDIKMDYVYYYDESSNPNFEDNFSELTLKEQFDKMILINGYDPSMFLNPEQFREKMDLSGEGNRLVRLISYKDKSVFLRMFDDNQRQPTEAEISAALKRLVMELPKVGFLTGHEERSTDNYGEKAYSMFSNIRNFRYSLINQGFDYTNITLDKEVPEDVDILVIADMKVYFTPEEEVNLDKFIARGGNLILAGEPNKKEVMNPLFGKFGVTMEDGCLVQPTVEYAANLMRVKPTKEADELNYWFRTLALNDYVITMPGTAALSYKTDMGYSVKPLFVTDSVGCWNELQTTNFEEDKVSLDTLSGEVEKCFTVALALERNVNHKNQKILILGDADCMSNGENTRTRTGISSNNYYLIMGAFYWFSDNEVPIDVRRPYGPDNKIFISEMSLSLTKIIFVWVLPILLLLTAIIIWLRRRGR
jgi:ABC-type transport system involved in multi-copper enzyme maturation, permease component